MIGAGATTGGAVRSNEREVATRFGTVLGSNRLPHHATVCAHSPATWSTHADAFMLFEASADLRARR